MGFACVSACLPIVHFRFGEYYIDGLALYDYPPQQTLLMGIADPSICCLINEKKEYTVKSSYDYLVLSWMEKDLFKKGMLFHLYSDCMKDELVKKMGILEEFPELMNGRDLLLDLVLDELFFSRRMSFRAKANLVGLTVHEMMVYKSGFEIMRWHRFVKDYVSESPLEHMKCAIEGGKMFVGWKGDKLEKNYTVLRELENHPRMIELAQKLNDRVINDICRVILEHGREEIKWKYEHDFRVEKRPGQ